MRLIDGDALASKLFDHHFSVPVLENEQKVLSEALHMIHEAPTIIKCGITSEGLPLMDLTPRTRGEWLRTWEVDEFTCDKCRSLIKQPTVIGKPTYKYCPNCGANIMQEAEP